MESCGDSSRFRTRTCNGYGKDCVCDNSIDCTQNTQIEYSECKNNESCKHEDGVWVKW